MSLLSLDGIIDVSVELSTAEIYQRGYNTALIIGEYNSAHPEDVKAGIKFYANMGEIIQEFSAESDIYKAAALYFGQEFKSKGVYIGCLKDPTEEVESLADAIARLRNTNSEWYVCIPTVPVMNAAVTVTSSTINITNLSNAAAFVEACPVATILACSLSGAFEDTYAGADKEILSLMKATGYSRTIIQVEDLNVNTVDENKPCIAAIIGYAMGRNNRLSQAYSLAYKSLVGISPMVEMSAQDLDDILSANGNIYISQGYYYNLFRQGKMCSGDNFDEIVYLDMLIDALKSSIMNVLIGNAKIPQTEAGLNALRSAMVTVLEQYREVQFIAPGIWNGETVLSLEKGDALESGYLIQFSSIASQTPEQRALRIAPPCYICIKLAGAIEHIAISLIVDR